MSVISTVANYGGRVVDNQQGVKQFYVSGQSVVAWIYKRLKEQIVITTADTSKPVFINNDLIVKKDLYVEGSIYNPSDEKLKENIESISLENIDNLFKINPIHFSYKQDKKKLKHFGVLAQDVEKVFPELVHTVETLHYDYKTVNYQELIPIMLSKMKQMQNEIDELKERVKK
jgi:hypothetical protein